MTLAIVLLIAIGLIVAYFKFKPQIASVLATLRGEVHPAATPASPPSQAAPSAAPSQPDTGTDNPFIRGYRQSNPQYVDVKPGDSGPGESQVDALGNVKFAEAGQNIIINGPGERYSTVPDGFKGTMRFEVGINPNTKFPYSVYVDGQLAGTAVTDGIVVKEIPISAGERHTLRIDQADNSSVTAEFRAYRKA